MSSMLNSPSEFGAKSWQFIELIHNEVGSDRVSCIHNADAIWIIYFQYKNIWIYTNEHKLNEFIVQIQIFHRVKIYLEFFVCLCTFKGVVPLKVWFSEFWEPGTKYRTISSMIVSIVLEANCSCALCYYTANLQCMAGAQHINTNRGKKQKKWNIFGRNFKRHSVYFLNFFSCETVWHKL